jgi:hypothetical protein
VQFTPTSSFISLQTIFVIEKLLIFFSAIWLMDFVSYTTSSAIRSIQFCQADNAGARSYALLICWHRDAAPNSLQLAQPNGG